jgi:hypothetical protein
LPATFCFAAIFNRYFNLLLVPLRNFARRFWRRRRSVRASGNMPKRAEGSKRDGALPELEQWRWVDLKEVVSAVVQLEGNALNLQALVDLVVGRQRGRRR